MLVERYKANPKRFEQATSRNLLVAIALFVLGAGIAAFGVHDVGLDTGGVALLTMALFPFLVGLAALDDVRWRRALARRNGVPPPRPQFRLRVPRASTKSGGVEQPVAAK